MGYSKELINSLIIRKSSALTIIAVRKFHNVLHSDYDLNFEQIKKIAAHDGGSKNIKAIQQFFPVLQELGFAPKQMVRMVAHIGGSNNIEAILEHYEKLISLESTKEQMVRMVAHGGGSKNIEAILEHYEKLISLKFTKKQIIRMVAQPGGSLTLKLLAEDDCLEKFNMISELPAGESRRNALITMLEKTGICVLQSNHSLIDFSWLDSLTPSEVLGMNNGLDDDEMTHSTETASSISFLENLSAYLSQLEASKTSVVPPLDKTQQLQKLANGLRENIKSKEQ